MLVEILRIRIVKLVWIYERVMLSIFCFVLFCRSSCGNNVHKLNFQKTIVFYGIAYGQKIPFMTSKYHKKDAGDAYQRKEKKTPRFSIIISREYK